MTTNGNGTPESPEQTEAQGTQPAGGLFGIPAKWLIIGGGAGGGVLLVVIVVVVLLVTGVFGGGGGGSGASGGNSVLGYIPADAGGVVIGDNWAMLNGDVPEDYVEYLEESEASDYSSFALFSEAYDSLDIDDDDVAVFAVVANENLDDTLVIVQGDFEFDVIREELEDGLDCEDDDYRGYELWECPGQGFPAVALFEKDGYLVFAAQRPDDLEDMLTLKSRTPEKLADAEDSEIQGILDQAGNGWLRVAVITDTCVISRCEGVAFALGESDDSEAIPASYAVMFSSERAASGAEGDVGVDDLLEKLFAELALELDIEEVKADGEFIVGDGIAEFVDPDGPRSSNPSVGSENSNRSTQAVPTATPTPPPAIRATTLPAMQAATPRPEPTATPVPQLEPASVFSLIPENATNVLWVHWEQTLAGSYLPSRIEDQVFNTMDIFRKGLDVSPDDVSEMALYPDQTLTVLKGNFDLSSIRGALGRRNAEQVNYRGYELWRGSGGATFALFDEYIAYSRHPIEPVLQNLYRGTGSLADASENNDMRLILNKLGNAVIVNAVAMNCPFEHCLGHGWAITEIDESSGTGKMNIGVLFRNQRAAAEAAAEYDGILNFLQGRHGINIQDTIPDGNFVVGNAIWEFK